MGFRWTLRRGPTESENSKLEEWRMVCVGMLGVAQRGRETRKEWQHRVVCEKMHGAEQKRRKLCRSSCLVRSQSGWTLEKGRERVAAGSAANGRLYEKLVMRLRRESRVCFFALLVFLFPVYAFHLFLVLFCF